MSVVTLGLDRRDGRRRSVGSQAIALEQAQILERPGVGTFCAAAITPGESVRYRYWRADRRLLRDGYFVDVVEFFLDAGAVTIHLEVKHGGFRGVDALHLPLGGDHAVDEIGFDAVRRLESLQVFREHELVKVFAFVDDEDVVTSGEAVPGCVAGRSGFSFVGDGAFGISPLRRVDSICLSDAMLLLRFYASTGVNGRSL